MSMDLMVKAMKTKVGNPLRKLVLLKLADNANDQGECWPSYQYIADQCEIGRSTVKSHIKALAELGFLKIEVRNDGKSSNLYVLTISEGNFSDADNEENKCDNPVMVEHGQILTQSNHDLTRSAHDPLTGSAPDPRTSHSLESVKESIKESKPKKSAKPTLRTRMVDRYSTSIPESSIDDALEHRKAKGVVKTDKAGTMFFDEVLQCSQELQITPSAVIDIVILRDWKGVNVEWVSNHLRQARPAVSVIQNQPMIASPNSRQAVSNSIANIHDTDW